VTAQVEPLLDEELLDEEEVLDVDELLLDEELALLADELLDEELLEPPPVGQSSGYWPFGSAPPGGATQL
jgi:hypothetical protein